MIECMEKLKLLYSEDEIQARTKELAAQIENIFDKDEDIYVICVLKGSIMFFTDLIKHLRPNTQLEFIRISSYGNNFKSTQNLKAIDLTLPHLEGKNVLIVEDIIDTGYTAKFLTDLIALEHHPKKSIFVSLLNKKCERKVEIEPDLYGFEIGNVFIVGYGLDYNGYCRNIPYVGYVETSD